jgi:hypothetical protein
MFWTTEEHGSRRYVLNPLFRNQSAPVVLEIDGRVLLAHHLVNPRI